MPSSASLSVSFQPRNSTGSIVRVPVFSSIAETKALRTVFSAAPAFVSRVKATLDAGSTIRITMADTSQRRMLLSGQKVPY